METPLLHSKLYRPPSRPQAVARPRLLAQLTAGLMQGRKLTLIAAPAGFGKTSLLSQWLDSTAAEVAWLALDEADSDHSRFLSYLIAALQTASPTLGQQAQQLRQSPQPPPPETLLTSLLNDIAARPEQLMLVLDDYHRLDSPAVDESLRFLLDYQPPNLHLVIATREDPPLPLARLRARGKLSELRAADLRFTPAEASTFFAEAMGLSLNPADIATLENRTEGWVAGLQLAALALQNLPQQSDIERFIQNFGGSHRFVLDYLLEEVLHQQSEAVQNFLLHTALLDRFCAPLCAALLDGPETQAQAMLIQLEQANLFIIPLDSERRWYRYHHLFADLLRAKQRQAAAQTADLHLRASKWYEAHADPEAAIHHALAAEDFERTATLLEAIWPTMDAQFRAKTWLKWASHLPPKATENRPLLWIAYAWAYFSQPNLAQGEAYLHRTEAWLKQADLPATLVTAQPTALDHLPASLASARAYLAMSQGDAAQTIQQARQALNLLPAADDLLRGPAASLLGLAYWANGELEAAYQALAEAMQGFERAGELSFALSGTYGLADIRLGQGQLRAAIEIYQRANSLVEAQNAHPPLPGTAELYLGLADLYREQNDLDTAQDYLAESLQLGQAAALGTWGYRVRLIQARFAISQGDLETALEYLNEAEAHYFRGPVPMVQPIAAQRARVWLKLGRLNEAQTWAATQNFSLDGPPSYLHEFDWLTLIRLNVAEHQHNPTAHPLADSHTYLQQLHTAASATQRWGSLLDIWLTQALLHQAEGQLEPALAALEKALVVAESEGYVRLFVDEGEAIFSLLKQVEPESLALKAYRQHLLQAFDRSPAPDQSALIEALSERELEVLGLIAQGLSNREIGERLFLALDTVKGHNRRIYAELQVSRRTEAVARGRELGLI